MSKIIYVCTYSIYYSNKMGKNVVDWITKWRNNQNNEKTPEKKNELTPATSKKYIKCLHLEDKKQQHSKCQTIKRKPRKWDKILIQMTSWGHSVCVLQMVKSSVCPRGWFALTNTASGIRNRWLRGPTAFSLAERLFSGMSGECLVGGGWRRGDQGAASTHSALLTSLSGCLKFSPPRCTFRFAFHGWILGCDSTESFYHQAVRVCSLMHSCGGLAKQVLTDVLHLVAGRLNGILSAL